ncbi:MAG TPA: ADP-glyceromanno-heptose 6-epimerase [Bacteroidales bacterium]|nr:ADP-glyceromanno-heptose 6-epimerase [Bacteroidales bacterium]
MIIVTGAAGFIGSCLINKLNNKGLKELVIVDDFSKEIKNKNIEQKAYIKKIERNDFFTWFLENYKEVNFIFHLGARTDTAEFNKQIFDELNFNYSCRIWELATFFQIPLVYASSAATYGLGELGYIDDHSIVEKLRPLNPYGESKNEFDKWVLQQSTKPPFWAGVKFFNVYGPNEYHKGRMASVVYHAYNQIKENGVVKLFKSHRAEYEDGKQLRDFIYVKDVVDICYFMMQTKPESGLYNVGTGIARTFLDLVRAVFKSMGLEERIEFIDIPEDIRDKYQYFTKAEINKLLSQGYKRFFYSLEEGIEDYVHNYLTTGSYF